ncbi:S8 family serine peptidase [bacterium]|nr:S8 family serine peptidase [bacterium]
MFRKIVPLLLTSLMLCGPLFGAFSNYTMGKMIITINLEYKIDPDLNSRGIVTTGIANIDYLNLEYRVTGFRRILTPQNVDNPKFSRFRNTFVFLFDDRNLDMEAVSHEYANVSAVRDAHPDWLTPHFRTPNDPIYGDQWHLRKIKADQAWNLTTGSEEIVMAGLDSGVDWKHDDLAPVLWQNISGGFGSWNHGEDADMDGHTIENIDGEWVFDPGDVNGIDDDLNGYVDDFIGFDFIHDLEDCYADDSLAEDCEDIDNDPSDFVLDGHGTHVSGAMIAATDNAYGIAGVNWNGKLMCLRCGYYSYDIDGMPWGYNQSEASYLAMEYAISKGIDVLNFSWGSGGIDTEMRDWVELAWEFGIILVGGAGNDNVEDIFYPANYHDVISVAGTDRYDHKASFSNYGEWIEISAPGENIWSTIPFNTFINWDGTSMASPVAAGVAALIISAFPDSSNEWVRDRLISTADNIDDLNPSYRGKLGSGRINVLEAIGPIRYPWLNFIRYTVSDSNYGDNNGRVDPGEEGEIVFSFSNLPGWQSATGVSISITSEDPLIGITNNFAYIPDIPPGETGSNASEPVRFLMYSDAIAHYTTINYTVSTEEGFSFSNQVTFMIGRPEILVYDQDGGDYFEAYYFPVLDEGRMIYDYWDRDDHGAIASSEMNLYETIIYFTGNAVVNTVPASEQANLSDFLVAGGNLLITGQYIGDEIGGSSFFQNYLKSIHTDDNLPSGWGFSIVGVSGEPISEGLELSTLGGSGNQISLSGISPQSGATGILRYNSDANPSRFAAIKYQDPTYNYKVINCGFGLEGIGNSYGDSLKILVFNMLEWFGYYPGIDGKPLTLPRDYRLFSYPNPFNSYTRILYEVDGTGKDGSVHVELTVYDLLGNLVKRLVDKKLSPGPKATVWEGTDESGNEVSSGLYLVGISTPNYNDMLKIMLLK